jgi:hypothetical protein
MFVRIVPGKTRFSRIQLGNALGVVFLLLIMLNHAVMACDGLVIHLPEHAQAYTSLSDNHSSNSSVVDDTEHQTEHAHVACYIAFFHGIELLNFSNSAIVSASHRVNFISYSPPVPPPNN